MEKIYYSDDVVSSLYAVASFVDTHSQPCTLNEIVGLLKIYLKATNEARDVMGLIHTTDYSGDVIQAIDAGVDDMPE